MSRTTSTASGISGRQTGVPRITIRDVRRTCATLLADLDVHPRVAMQILRHAEFSITMEIYTVMSSAATRAALKRLGESLDHDGLITPLLYLAAVRRVKRLGCAERERTVTWRFVWAAGDSNPEPKD